MNAKEMIWLPLDVPDLRTAGKHVRSLKGSVGVFKVGLQLIHRVGTPKLVRFFREIDPEVQLFVDGKFSDIPNTVGEAAAAIADLGVSYFNIHASAGAKAIEAAAKNKGDSKLLVVTVLTSLTTEDVFGMYVKPWQGDVDFETIFPDMKQLYIEEVVLGMAIMAAECGADGVICSPMELDVLSQDIGLRGFPCYTPGIRPLWARKNDQERVTTPSEAVKKGATGIIVGRPILQPPEEIGGPVEAAALIAEEIEAALAEIA